jgi:hypothetical protein
VDGSIFENELFLLGKWGGGKESRTSKRKFNLGLAV